MDRIVLLPMWANLLFATAILVLIGLALSKKINLSVNENQNLTKRGYYVIAAVLVLVETVLFFALAPMNELYDSYLIIVGVMMFLAFLVSALGCTESENKKMLLLTVGGIFFMLVILVTLIYCSVTFAAIWAATLTVLGFIGHILFSTKK